MSLSVQPPAAHNQGHSNKGAGLEQELRYYRVLDAEGSLKGGAEMGMDMQKAVDIYCAMLRNRIIDQQLERLQRQGRVAFHVGSLGEEASIVASAAALSAKDWIFPCYREIGALLWRGFPLQRYIDNMYGNVDDTVQGRQMPDHYTSREHAYASVSSPVGTQIPHAVGFAWAAKLKNDPIVTAVFFGDGATSSSDFHSAMTFAGVYRTPTIFLCRNNQWAISIPRSQQSACRHLADKGEGYGVRSVRCDGNDALAVHACVQEAAQYARSGQGPVLIELETYRLGSHSTSDDPTAYRSEDEFAAFAGGDPLKRLAAFLIGKKAWRETQEEAYRASVEQELKQCIQAAEAKAKPELQTMFEGVYATMPTHLARQSAHCHALPRAPQHGED